MERWETIKEHPNYEINMHGDVRKKRTGKILVPDKRLKHERVRVDGKYRYTARLVIDTFGWDF